MSVNPEIAACILGQLNTVKPVQETTITREAKEVTVRPSSTAARDAISVMVDGTEAFLKLKTDYESIKQRNTRMFEHVKHLRGRTKLAARVVRLYKDTVDDYRARIERERDAVSVLHTDYIATIAGLRAEAIEWKKKHNALESKQAETRLVGSEVAADNVRLREAIERQTECISRQALAITKTDDRLGKREKEIRELKDEIEALKEAQSRPAETSDEGSTIGVWEQAIDDATMPLRLQVSSLKNEVEAANMEVGHLRKVVEDCKEEIGGFKAREEEYKTKIDGLEKSLFWSRESLATSEKQAVQYFDDCQKLTRFKETQDQHIKKCQEYIAELTGKTFGEIDVTKIQTEIDSLREILARQKTFIQQQEAERKEKNQQINDLIAKNHELVRVGNESETKLASSQTLIDDGETRIRNLTRTVGEMNQAIDSLQRRLAAERDQCVGAIDELTKGFEKRLAELVDDRSRLATENASYHKFAERQETEIEELRHTCGAYAAKINVLETMDASKTHQTKERMIEWFLEDLTRNPVMYARKLARSKRRLFQ